MASASAPRHRPGIQPLRLRRPERKALKQVARWLCDVDLALTRLFADLCSGKRPWPLFVHGGVGSGKTYAALALSDLVAETRYETLEGACDAVMKGFAPYPGPLVLADGAQPCLMVLDEIGERARSGDLQYLTLKRVLDNREFSANRVGLYLSNLSPGGLTQLFDDRIVSRLTCGTVCKLEGEDRRQAHG
jgi:DNA replication protein DnaC